MNNRIQKILGNPFTVPIAVGVGSFGLGLGLGFILGRRKKFGIHDDPTKQKFVSGERTTQEILDGADAFLEEHADEETKARWEQEEKEKKERGYDIATPAEAFILDHLPGTMVRAEPPEPHPIEVVAHSIFASPTLEWDYEEEVRNRGTEAPYVLHRDEFYADELGYEQTTMTYYVGDDIMADQEDQPVYDYAVVVGPLLFGHGSGDPNVFHVRNDHRRAEYEVIRDEGHFSIEVLGLEMEQIQQDKDAIHPANRKFKPE